MKTLFTLFLAFILCLQAKAQLSDSITYKPAVIYYNADYQITKKEHAAYARVAYLPEKLKDIKDLHSPSFNGHVKDYYADGSLWGTGNYHKNSPNGQWNFYYPSGQLDCRGNFKGIWADGKWEYWWPNGQPLMVTEHLESDMRLLSFWNEAGEQTIKDGDGIYTAITTDERGRQMKMEGPYKGGYQFGRWTYGPVDGGILFEQTFDYKGRVIEGISYDGKRKKKYIGNKFKIRPEPDHLTKMSFWSRDQKVYESNYPLLADIMGCEAQRIDLTKNKSATNDHYYKIFQQHAAGTDTLEYGVPVIMPVFDKSMGNFLDKNIRYPQQLKDQNLEGLIVVQFYVKEDGSIHNPAILKGLHPLLDQEVIRVFKIMPKWKPATKHGKPIELFTTLPLRFSRRSIVREPDFNRGQIPDMDSRERTF